MKKRHTSKGYVLVYSPYHPRADKCGMVFEHIVIWEAANKTLLPSGFVIHHINGIKDDNRLENLCAMTSAAHTALHNSQRILSQETKEKISSKAKLRFACKEKHPRYKNIDTQKIKEEIANGKTIASVCKEYGISKYTFYVKIKGYVR